MSDKRVKTRGTKRISPKKSPCVLPSSKTKAAKKQLKMTTLTPDSGGDMAIETAPLADTSIFDASHASDGFGDVRIIPRTSADDFVVTTDPYSSVCSVTTTRVSDAFDVFDSTARSVLVYQPQLMTQLIHTRNTRRLSAVRSAGGHARRSILALLRLLIRLELPLASKCLASPPHTRDRRVRASRAR